MYTYNWYQWLAFFYIYCFFGWIFESTYVSLKKRHFVNRGFLRIPMLPLYGSGAVMMLWVSLPFKDNLFLVYLSGVIAATALEYVTGYVMEQLFKIRYWDYSNQKFQIHGYICLSSSIAWGFLTILMTEVIHEPIARIVLDFNPNILLFCVFIVTMMFTADAYESTKEALALGKSLEAMTKLKAEMEDLQARIAALKEEAAEHVSAVREGTAERLANAKEETAEILAAAKEVSAERLTAAREVSAEKLAAAKEASSERLTAAKEASAERLAAVREGTREKLALLTGQLEEVAERRHNLLPKNSFRHFYRRGLLRGNPGAVSTKFSAALKELKEQLQELND
ncbi:putative ABC transporter permease [Clostridium transplantifaecale]|uniref:putative ABC transporter permease n=1 Tax=Clostridium transplantifaecale TaxID=2479838 RepID=UPI000F62FE01|nr:putative ABC transporter permease [Clostridium transplantifaecale]